MRLHNATGRSGLDVDNHLQNKKKLFQKCRDIEQNCGEELNREMASHVKLGQAVFVAYERVPRIQGPPRVSYCIYIENSKENIMLMYCLYSDC